MSRIGSGLPAIVLAFGSLASVTGAGEPAPTPAGAEISFDFQAAEATLDALAGHPGIDAAALRLSPETSAWSNTSGATTRMRHGSG